MKRLIGDILGWSLFAVLLVVGLSVAAIKWSLLLREAGAIFRGLSD